MEKTPDPEDTDYTGPAGPEGTFAPRMSGGVLLHTHGYTDEMLQLAWEAECGPQPPDIPQLHKDIDFASSGDGWVRRRFMFDQLMKRMMENR
jgi:hypothetical protein